MKLLDVVKWPGTNYVAFVFEFIDMHGEYWKDMFEGMSDLQIRHYNYQVLKALDFTHSRGIMHRDLKP